MRKLKERWSLKRVLKEVLTTLVLIFIISQVVNFIRQPEVKENIYGYHLHDIKKSLVAFLEYKGEPLVVHFWGTWCPVCKFEASNIAKLSEAYPVITIAVNSGTNEEIASYMKVHHLDYRVINDEKGILAQKFNIDVYPTTLIYNAKGELKFTEVGYSTTLGLKARLELIK